MRRVLPLVMTHVALAGCQFGAAADRPAADAPAIDARIPIDSPHAGSVFDASITKVRVEIDYETGQQPYVGNIISFGDPFDVVTTNIDRLLAGKKQLTIPHTLATMQSIGAVPDEQLTASDILALANVHRTLHDSATEKTYYVVFVSGTYVDANGPQPGIMGVAIGASGVIAMFKDVIAGSSILPNVQRFVEQSILTHELGHAIGLVDNGVAMAAPHEDATHHCTNDKCVMYHLNEGASDMADYAAQYVLTANTILFDAACLADVDALTGGP